MELDINQDTKFERKQKYKSSTLRSEKIRRLLLVKRDFVIDPEGNAIYYWSGVVALAVVYNFWAVILRIAYSEMRTQAIPRMFFSCMDVAVDLIYLIDLLLNFRMGFLEEGILVKDPIKLADNYMLRRKSYFIRDVISALPFSSIALLFTGMLSRVVVCFTLARGAFYQLLIYYYVFADKTCAHGTLCPVADADMEICTQLSAVL